MIDVVKENDLIAEAKAELDVEERDAAKARIKNALRRIKEAKKQLAAATAAHDEIVAGALSEIGVPN